MDVSVLGGEFTMAVMDLGETVLKDEKYNDLVSKQIAVHGQWEPFQTEIMIHIVKKIYKEGDVFLDVGAHIGYYSLIMAHMGVMTYAFEPDEEYFHYLNKSLEINKNFSPLICVVPGLVGRVSAAGVKSLDAISELTNSSVLCIKVDTEGCEPDVVAGAKKLLERGSVKTLIIEITPALKGVDYLSLIAYIADLGYLVFDIGLSHPRRLDETINPFSSNEITLLNEFESPDWTTLLALFDQSNYLFVRRDLVASLM